ncbi:MAG: BACON domain-containing protein [Bacteroidales bacterium]|nr:BACON domain-containing protein [Bacteroidales bacterium]
MLTVIKTSKNAHSWDISPNTGRNQKRFYSQVSVEGKNTKATTTYIQDGKPEFIELVSPSSINIPAVPEGMAYIQINAKSNSERISASISDISLNSGIKIKSTYINGDEYKQGALIAGDPGANEEYLFSINLEYSENTTTTAIRTNVVLEDNAGHSVTVLVIQAASAPAITVSPTSVDVPAAGGSGTIMVSANDEWFVSTVENI